MTSYVAAVIFARGGSKGVPRKNVRLLGGAPLLAHAIAAARESSRIDRIIVSTDDAEIADVAVRFGAEVPFMRPPELATDTAPEWLAWQHAIRFLQETSPETTLRAFVSVPTTSPLRVAADLDACVDALTNSDADAVVTVRPSERNPYFNMVTIDAAGHARLVISEGAGARRRQDAPPVFDITTVAYAARPEFVLKASSLFDGRLRAVQVPAERALDIDTELDFAIAECLWARRA